MRGFVAGCVAVPSVFEMKEGSMFKSRWFSWMAPLWLALGISVPALSASAQSPVILETAPPARIESYPRVVFEGRPTYEVNGRWYFRHGRDWAYYRTTPAALWRERARAARAVERVREARVRADAARRAEWRQAAAADERAREYRQAQRVRDRYDYDYRGR